MTAQEAYLGQRASGLRLSNRTGDRGVGTVWWLNPFTLCLFFLVPLFTLIFLVPSIFGARAVNLTFLTYFTWKYYLIGVVWLLALANGALIGALTYVVNKTEMPSPVTFNRFYLDVLAVLTIFAYLIWYRSLFIDPSALVALATGNPSASYTIRATNRTIAGITTLTQLGGAYVVFHLYQTWGAQRPFVGKRYAFYLYTIVGLALFRVYAWSERLALIEVVVPIAVLYVAYRAPRTPLSRAVVHSLPFLGIVALLIFFGITEYVRSWASHYQYQSTGFWEFVSKRLVSYYYTALNNGAGMLTVYEWPTWRMEAILDWLYKFPFLIGAVVRFVADVRPETSFLERYANPEYNNLSGIFMVILDVGLVGGFIFAAALGWLLGYLWRALLWRQPAGVFYPICFLTLLEMFRILYLTGGRAFPTLLALLIGYLLFKENAPRAGRSGSRLVAQNGRT
jgi:oligosaccharide repeat unit polymerase